MKTRSRTEKVVFLHPFLLKGVDRTLPAGTYEILSEDELIDGLSFPVYRRLNTFIMAPAALPYQASTEMIPITPLDLANAQRIDAGTELGART